MRDTNLEVLRQTPFNFGFLSAAATQDVIVADGVDVSWVKTIGLSARVHRANIGTGAKFEFILFGVNPSPTDGTAFVTGSAGLITSASIAAGAAAGTLITWSTGSVYSDPVHPFVRLVLRATGPSGTAVNLYGELSASISLRAP
jgi:hypothetical protein